MQYLLVVTYWNRIGNPKVEHHGFDALKDAKTAKAVWLKSPILISAIIYTATEE